MSVAQRGAGRFAPSPSGPLHLGNLRTAILAWLFARSTGRDFWLRVEDLDRVRAGAEKQQLNELAALGLDWDAEPLRQSARLDVYRGHITSLREQDLLYECFCSRKDIAEASSAPHALPGAYPGTCRFLSESEKRRRRRERPAAWRLRSTVSEYPIDDVIEGHFLGEVDDFVIVRNDGVPAYNLAVVVDDGEQHVDQVVRGDDLLTSAPRQAYLATLLGYTQARYAHVPLALSPQQRRLAKRDGAVTLEDLGAERTRDLIFDSLHLPRSLDRALAVFDPDELPREPWIVDPRFVIVRANH